MPTPLVSRPASEAASGLRRPYDSDDQLAAVLALAAGHTLLAVRASGLFATGELGQTGDAMYADGRADWAVHVALSIDGVPRACAVAFPALDRVMSTAHVPLLADRGPGPIQIAVSRSRPPESRIDGSPLIYNRPNPALPDLLICRPERAGALLGAVETATGADHGGPG
jgi:hypothetical protein